MNTLDFIYTTLIISDSINDIAHYNRPSPSYNFHYGLIFLLLIGVCVAINQYFSSCARASQEKHDAEEKEEAKNPIQIPMPKMPKSENRMKVYMPDSPYNLYHPKFEGKPHEVLGVDSDAGTKWIQYAHKHWMKEYHPDHLQKNANEKERNEANVQCQRLHMAKDMLLRHRKKSA